jgi:hypothetical protein
VYLYLNTNNRGTKMNALRKYDILDSYMDEDYQDDNMAKSLCDLSIYELGSIDHYVILRRNKKFGFDLEIENEEDQTSYEEKGLHPYALDSIALFCRRFLTSYDNIMDKE